MPSTSESLADRTSPGVQLRAELKTVAYWVSLGATAGGLGGVLVGGVGGRLAMFLIRLTSDDSIRGLESDDGFTMGRFDVTATLSLLFVTAFLGGFFGLFVVFGRPFFPHRWMPALWGVAGAMVGGSILVHSDGVDFTLPEPRWLAVALFIVIPGAGAVLIARLVDQLQPVWWIRRRATGIISLAALPAVIFFPVAIAAAVGSALWLLALRFEGVRDLPGGAPARVAAAVVFAAVVALATAGLVNDVRAIL